MKLKKGDILHNVEIGDLVAEGKCISRQNELVVFSTLTAPGDVADVQLRKIKKNFAEASLVKLVMPSPHRVEPFCAHFGVCGGCKWQHIAYDTQLHHKEKQVFDAIDRIGKVSGYERLPILASVRDRFYRNKLEFTATDARWLTQEQVSSQEAYDRRGLGFHVPGMFDKILDVEECHLQSDVSNEIRNAIRDFSIREDIPFFNIRAKTGQLRNVIIRTATTGDVMVIIQLFYDDVKREKLMEYLKTSFPNITSLFYIINSKGNETIHDQDLILVHGKDHIIERMEDLQYKIGPKSFYQTNSEQAEVLYKVAKDFAQIQPHEVVYDLYTGTGTIANYVAKSAKKVVGVEYVEAAIEDAHINAQLNGIENTSFYAGDMKHVLNQAFIDANGVPDVIITDPPRAGMHEEVVDMLLRIGARRIVYVSCNPATQARDVELLSAKYHLIKVQPVDMFPHTYHVESVALLELK